MPSHSKIVRPPPGVAARRSSTLAGRLTAILAAFIVLATAGVAVGEYRAGRVRLVGEAQGVLATQAAFAADRLEAALSARLGLVELWAGLETAQDLAVDDIDFRLSSSLADLAGMLADGSEAAAARDTSRVLAGSDPAWAGDRSLRLPPPVREVFLQSDPSRLSVARGRTGPAVLVATAPVASRMDGSSLGRMVVWTPLSRFLAHELPLEVDRLVLRSADGQTLSRGMAVPAPEVPVLSAVAERETPLGRLAVEVVEPMTDVTGELASHARQLAFLAGLFLVLALPGSLLVVHSTTSGLKRLTDAAHGLDAANPAPLPEPSAWAPREVRVLGDAMEQMIARLEHKSEELARSESLAAVGMLTKSLAHEIRTPLTVLRAGAEVLLRSDTTTDREREVSRMLHLEVERLARLVDDLLVFGRPSSPDTRALDLATIAHAAVSTLQGTADEAKVQFVVDAEPAPTEGDPDQLRQVALNLISNAIRACEGGGTVTVRSGGGPEGRWLEVEDDGAGIEAARMEEIWRPLVTTHRSGSGLGLPIVKQLVEAHGGRVTVSSTPGKGTTMRVLLPTIGAKGS